MKREAVEPLPPELSVFGEFLDLSRKQGRPTAKVLPFPKQDAFVDSLARFLDASCSRRAGKSNGLARRFFKTMERHPKSTCLYLALTRESALEIMWPVLEELDAQLGVGCEFIESKLLVVHPNGARLKLFGADQKNFAKRLKGKKHPGIAVDEVQDFGSHLESLVDDVLTPCMADYEDSWLALTGTPSPVPAGYWFEVAKERKHGYEHHEWTLFENPYMPRPEVFLADLCQRRGWDEEHPTLLREWKNRWTLDLESLWVRYREGADDFVEPPNAIASYSTILAVDIGWKDSDAIAVILYSDDDPTTYLYEEVITEKQDITALVDQLEALSKRYRVTDVVMDTGGLGKKIAEEIRRRRGIDVRAADKARKQENVAFLNDALRAGRFKARKTSRFALDSFAIQVDWTKTTPDRVVLKGPHSDIIDAVLYGFKESPAYRFEAKPAPPPKQGTEAWGKAEEARMWQQEQELARREREAVEGGFGTLDDEWDPTP